MIQPKEDAISCALLNVCAPVQPAKLFMTSAHLFMYVHVQQTWTSSIHVHAWTICSVTAHAGEEPPVLEYTGLELSRVLECNSKPLPILDVHVPGKGATYMYMHVHTCTYIPEVHYSQLTFSPQPSISVFNSRSANNVVCIKIPFHQTGRHHFCIYTCMLLSSILYGCGISPRVYTNCEIRVQCIYVHNACM